MRPRWPRSAARPRPRPCSRRQASARLTTGERDVGDAAGGAHRLDGEALFQALLAVPEGLAAAEEEAEAAPGRFAGCLCLFLLTRPAGFPNFADLREDRVVLYGRATNKIEEFSYKIKATNAGKFAVPAAYGESMYDPKVRARSAAVQLVVDTP